MIETIAKIAEISKEIAEKINLKEATEILETTDAELLQETPIINTLDEINNTSLETLKLQNEEALRIKTINSYLAGELHPESGVPYETDIIEMPNGDKIEGVFPVFESFADIQLPEELLQETDAKQMKYCNEKLKEDLENNPELRAKFTEQQLEEIDAGYKPSGYTWHHHQESGKMQLVETKKHSVSGHTGGKSIWGEGNR